MGDEIEKINKINPLRNPYAVNKDFDELIYKRRIKDPHHKHKKEFRDALVKKTSEEVPKVKPQADREKRKKWHAKYKNGIRIY